MAIALWTFDQIYSYLSKYSNIRLEDIKFEKHNDELWVGWILGKFLSSVKKNEYLLGLQISKIDASFTLQSIPKSKIIVEADNFDLALIGKNAIEENKIVDFKEFYRIQVKRYKRPNPSTADCIDFIKKYILKKYPPDRSLNFAVLIETGFKIDIATLQQFVRSSQFNFANAWFIGYFLSGKFDPYVMPIFPDFSGIVWKPVKD